MVWPNYMSVIKDTAARPTQMSTQTWGFIEP
jgi:hypothetical protein